MIGTAGKSPPKKLRCSLSTTRTLRDSRYRPIVYATNAGTQYNSAITATTRVPSASPSATPSPIAVPRLGCGASTIARQL